MHLKPDTYLHRNCFKILKQIDQGGFGITYLAEERGWLKSTGYGEQYVPTAQPEIVVIKELFFDDFCSRNEKTGLVYVTNTNKKVEFEKLVNKQLEEGRIIKNLNHQNIVNTKDIFKENDTAYMVLEYIDGVNLEKIVNTKGKLSQDKAIEYIKKILLASAYIHEKKVLHLDITPNNVLIKKSNDEPVLIDFGASQTYGIDNHIASKTSKLVAGFKKHYAPYEQQDLDNLKEFDATFDTYAIGATLYFLLTGEPPPTASSILSEKKKLEKPSDVNKSVSRYLDTVIFKALSSKYPERYKSAKDFLNAIYELQTYIPELPLNEAFKLSKKTDLFLNKVTENVEADIKNIILDVNTQSVQAVLASNNNTTNDISRVQTQLLLDGVIVNKELIENGSEISESNSNGGQIVNDIVLDRTLNQALFLLYWFCTIKIFPIVGMIYYINMRHFQIITGLFTNVILIILLIITKNKKIKILFITLLLIEVATLILRMCDLIY